MRVDAFDFDLPERLIATEPACPRDSARLLVVGEQITDSIVSALPRHLRRGDVLVFNDTRVLPARLYGQRGNAKIEVLLHRLLPGDGLQWEAFARPAKRLRIGDDILFAPDFTARVAEKRGDGQVVLVFDAAPGQFRAQLARYGQMPLPPYIEKQRAANASDIEKYQTIYAKDEGSVAAPTAGLHFTPQLFAALDAAGIARHFVTLHVGAGTFLPVKAEDTNDHVMHAESYTLSAHTAAALNEARQQGKRIFPVGTTSLRVLESCADEAGVLHPGSGETRIFITPGYRFRVADGLLTNFHLPRSTLFMLVCAFAGEERMKKAYNYAISNDYRFYSYGDACLLWPRSLMEN